MTYKRTFQAYTVEEYMDQRELPEDQEWDNTEFLWSLIEVWRKTGAYEHDIIAMLHDHDGIPYEPKTFH